MREVLRGPRFADLTGTTSINARGSPLLDDSPPTGRFGIVVVGAAFVLALATFLVFAGFTPIIPTATVVLTLLVGDGLVVVILIILISIELARLQSGASGGAGGRPAAQSVRGVVFAGRRDPGDHHRGCRYGFGRVGDQSAIYERRRRLHQRSQSGDPAYRESQCRALLRDVELTAGDIGRSAALAPVGSHSVQRIFQLALARRWASPPRRS